MEKIALNFVLEFARDLQKLLETLNKEFGQNLVHWNVYYKKKIVERASELIEGLYRKYKDTLDLKVDKTFGQTRIIIESSDRKRFYLPNEYIVSRKFFILKERLDNLINLMEISNPEWHLFIVYLSNSFSFPNNKSRSLNLNTLEKIRFFMSFINEYPDFDFENIPIKFNNKVYLPKYKHWRINSSYLKLYNKYIRQDRYFFFHHVNLSPIPNYQAWNLKLVFFDYQGLQKLIDLKSLNYFPIQVFEDIKGNPVSILGLISEPISETRLKEFVIQKYNILNNFNLFDKDNNNSISVKPRQETIFSSHVKFLDEMNSDEAFKKFYTGTFKYTIDFRKKQNFQEKLNSYLKIKTIQELNLRNFSELSAFNEKFLSENILNNNPYRDLFHIRYTFPDFNFNDNFLLILNKKKRNTKFTNFINFLKNWTYQSIIYELKDKIVIYGFLLPKFDYSNDKIVMNEIFNELDIDYSFYVNNIDLRQSNLSIYILPSSKYYIEDKKIWNLEKIEFPITINAKENLINEQIAHEKVN